ncbi:ankyrin repeat-containing protein ITN1-like [Cornus florida]|uniref:ankyrin repeat-containing protein ITN1-like n=1 Tax=Cornus florida TaxID=4283 RepID=UPI0028997F3F|nr:ankyrin repeat-containing protein ITN1-like [Cornus florida]
MNELVVRASTYKYDYNGKMPHESQNFKDGGGAQVPTSPPSQIFKDGGGTEVPTLPPLTDDPNKSLGIIMNCGNNSLDARKNKDQNKKDQNESDGTDKRDALPGSFAAKIELINVMDKFLNAYPNVVQVLNSSFKDLRHLQYEKKQMHDYGKRETPLLIAAKMGIVEMVEKIICTFPVAIQDLDSNKKNVVLLAVENRQAQVYNLLLKCSYLKESVLRQVDDQGNSALHLPSMFGDHQPWHIPGAALQIQWEIKWYKFVKHSMPPQFFVRYNKMGENPSEIFTRTHQKLVKSGSNWLIKTSESCSVVTALIAAVAFATSATVPGGADQDTGVPILGSEPAFVVFSISSLIALCYSVTALVFFLAILTSRCQEKDFHKDLPRKLLLGLTSLFASIASMLVSFCAAHFFLLKDKLKSATFPIYAVTCLPVTFFAFAQLTLYGDLIWAILTKVPQRSYKVFPH